MATTTERRGRTPGSWYYQEESDAYTHIVRGDGRAFVTQFSQDTTGRAEADARLTAAAPDLLAAAKGARDRLRQELQQLLRSYCILSLDQQPLRDTLDPDEAEDVEELEAQIVALDAAIAKAEPQS